MFSLLKAGSSQIERTSEYGFEVDLRFRDLALPALRDLIDQEFYTLSEAHYQRYMQTADMFAGQE